MSRYYCDEFLSAAEANLKTRNNISIGELIASNRRKAVTKIDEAMSIGRFWTVVEIKSNKSVEVGVTVAAKLCNELQEKGYHVTVGKDEVERAVSLYINWEEKEK